MPPLACLHQHPGADSTEHKCLSGIWSTAATDMCWRTAVLLCHQQKQNAAHPETCSLCESLSSQTNIVRTELTCCEAHQIERPAQRGAGGPSRVALGWTRHHGRGRQARALPNPLSRDCRPGLQGRQVERLIGTSASQPSNFTYWVPPPPPPAPPGVTPQGPSAPPKPIKVSTAIQQAQNSKTMSACVHVECTAVNMHPSHYHVFAAMLRLFLEHLPEYLYTLSSSPCSAAWSWQWKECSPLQFSADSQC